MSYPSWTVEALAAYLDRLASSAPTPGGGSAACVAGALGASLGSMVVAVARTKGDALDWTDLDLAFRTVGEEFLRLAQEDEAAFRAVMTALRRPKDDPARAAGLQEALLLASSIPLRAAERTVDLLRRLETLVPQAPNSVVSDVGAGAHLALATLRSSLLNVDVNLRSLEDPGARARLVRERRRIERTGSAIHDNLARAVSARLAPEPRTA